jgi:hypothetical protein
VPARVLARNRQKGEAYHSSSAPAASTGRCVLSAAARPTALWLYERGSSQHRFDAALQGFRASTSIDFALLVRDCSHPTPNLATGQAKSRGSRANRAAAVGPKGQQARQEKREEGGGGVRLYDS